MGFTRRVQRTGGSTLIVSLPKEWTRRVGVEPGTEVYMEILPDGSLRIYPRDSALKGRRGLGKSIRLDGSKNLTIAIKEVVSFYLAGYDSLRVVFDKSSRELAESLRTIIESSMLGFNVLEETVDSITFYTTIDSSSIKSFDALARIFRTTLSMLNDVREGLEARSTTVLGNVVERDWLVDRLYLLVVKQLTRALMGHMSLEELGLKSPAETLHVFLAAKSIERVADHAVLMAQHGSRLINAGHSVPREILELLRRVYEGFEAAGRAFISLDKTAASKAAILIEDNRSREDKIKTETLSRGGPPELYLILDSMRRINGYSLDIVETVFDIVAIREYIEDREKIAAPL